MRKKVNKHLGMDQDELAASFDGYLHPKTKGAKSTSIAKKKTQEQEDELGLTEKQIEKWNKILTKAQSKNKAVPA